MLVWSLNHWLWESWSDRLEDISQMFHCSLLIINYSFYRGNQMLTRYSWTRGLTRSLEGLFTNDKGLLYKRKLWIFEIPCLKQVRVKHYISIMYPLAMKVTIYGRKNTKSSIRLGLEAFWGHERLFYSLIKPSNILWM